MIMEYFGAFVVCGLICLAGQLIYDNTNLTPGHITSLFVVLGAFLDFFNLYAVTCFGRLVIRQYRLTAPAFFRSPALAIR